MAKSKKPAKRTLGLKGKRRALSRLTSAPAMTDQVIWSTAPHYFQYMGQGWNVTAAKQIIVTEPRKIEWTPVKPLADLLADVRVRPDGSKMIRSIGVAIDPRRVRSDKTIDLAIPLIAVTWRREILVIDGWHRVARARSRRVVELPIVFLTSRESAAVKCPLAW